MYKLAKEAGMPKQVLDTYFQYIDNLDVRFHIGKTLGEAHRDVASIPQGCPFSMNMVALLMRPWILKMKENGIEPRTLADDFFFYANGDDHEIKSVKGMEISLQFFEDIGAEVAKNILSDVTKRKNEEKPQAKNLWQRRCPNPGYKPTQGPRRTRMYGLQQIC